LTLEHDVSQSFQNYIVSACRSEVSSAIWTRFFLFIFSPFFDAWVATKFVAFAALHHFWWYNIQANHTNKGSSQIWIHSMVRLKVTTKLTTVFGQFLQFFNL
jgi:hypothetical protein